MVCYFSKQYGPQFGQKIRGGGGGGGRALPLDPPLLLKSEFHTQFNGFTVTETI